MASAGEDQVDCHLVPRPSISQLLQRARSEGAVTITPDEVTSRVTRGLQLCSGVGGSDSSSSDGGGSDFASASIVNRDDRSSDSSRNNAPASMNQFDGRSLGNQSQNPRPPAAEYEVTRLSTFRNWPSMAPVTPSALARAGFFYTGRDDIVECFICQGQIRDFEYGDTAMGEHKKHFPKCPFVKNKNHGNVPMAGTPDFSKVATSDPAGASGSSTEKKVKEKEASLFSSKDAEKLRLLQKKRNRKVRMEVKSRAENRVQAEVDDPATRADNQAKLTFKSEFKRLLSYQNWPESCPVDPRDCAKAGFFYTGKEDVVQCFACFGKLGNFKDGDVPMVEHNRHFPSCPYILGLTVGNQPITSVQMASALQAINYKDQSMFGQRNQTQQPKPKGPLTQTAKPTADWGPTNQRPNQKRVFAKVRHPQFASEQARLESYERWPPAVGIAPIQLARAGFFYTGNNDSCKCFYCDGGLKNWEPKDEPWMEHARWFPRCEWLIQQRGQAYVDYVVHNFPPPRISAEVLSAGGNRKGNTGGGEDAGEDEAGTFQTAQMAVRGSGTGSDEEEEELTNEREPEAGVARTTVPRRTASGIEQTMKSKVAKTVLDMGYDPRLVRAVIRRRMQSTEPPFANAQELLEAIFEAEGSIDLDDEPTVEDPPAGDVSQLAKDLQNVTLVERSPPEASSSSKGSETTAGALSSSAYAGKLGDQGTSSGHLAPQTAPPAGVHTRTDEDRLLPATVHDLKSELERYRDSQLCKICMDNDMSTVFLPCNHMVACDGCANALAMCPICRKKIRNVVHIYKT
ncbi:LOW QUALITY PROTEIN: baculoviral IAP repeat-containing protein 3-like [Amphiura filiformis]|uniref:LOW QUALITY PROTEIN: baculoviral IAP repeat-containing protein 3-like n=1 Tax=Amphiura filiformis TaxID=82378 RepID=UPI003B223111